MYSMVIIAGYGLIQALSLRDRAVKEAIQEETPVQTAIKDVEGKGVIEVQGEKYMVEQLQLPQNPSDEPPKGELFPKLGDIKDE